MRTGYVRNLARFSETGLNTETPQKLGRGKGNKKELNGFDFLNIKTNPPCPGDVAVREFFQMKGFDLWTGENLKEKDLEFVDDEEHNPVLPIFKYNPYDDVDDDE